MSESTTTERSASPVIQVHDLSVGYDGKPLLTNVSFVVRRGEVLAILGASGSGKSTLLKHMIGLYRPLSGTVCIDGDELTGIDQASRSGLLRKFGVMYQQGALFGSMTLLQNVRLPIEMYTGLRDDAIDLVARTKLDLVQLCGFEERMPAQLSGGMRKRAAIARAMALDPEILFLDEPSAGLDPITAAEVDELILRLKHSLGMTFVVVTHELPSIFTIADRVIMLDIHAKGIIAEGDPRQLQCEGSDPRVRRFLNRSKVTAP